MTGALNTNIIRRATRYILDEAAGSGQVIAVGKKGRDFFVRTKQNVVAEFTGLGDDVTLDEVRGIVEVAIDDFMAGQVDAVYVIYTRFVNTLTQRPEVVQILPMEAPGPRMKATSDYIFEPSPEAVLNELLPRYVEVQVYQAIWKAWRPSTPPGWSRCATRRTTPRSSCSRTDAVPQQGAPGADHREVSEIAAGANALAG